MELVNIYEAYTRLNKELINWLDKQVMLDFVDNEEEITKYLENVKKDLESLLEQTEDLEVEPQYETDLSDLRYLLADSLFLSIDAINFYHYKEIGRLKMRVINYTNKRRSTEVFGQ